MAFAKVSREKHIAIVLFAVTVVALSAVVLYFYRAQIAGSFLFEEPAGYQNITFTDAVVTCRKRVKKQFAKKIQTLVVDDHSSRYDNQAFLYKIFMEVDVRDDDNERPTLLYINCFISANNGRVEEFESFADVEKGASKAVDGTNMFGFPLKK